MNRDVSATLLWFRRDLRLRDNPALDAALAHGGAVVPVFIRDEIAEGKWPAGGAARGWLHRSLEALAESLRACGSRLVIARGNSAEVLRTLARDVGASAVFWNRRYEPAAVAHEAAITRELSDVGIQVQSYNAALLHEPHTVKNKSGGPYRVFGPFWRHCLTLPAALPSRSLPRSFKAPKKWPRSLDLAALELSSGADVPDQERWRSHWTPGEAGAWRRLRQFVRETMSNYAEQRDEPARDGTSGLSPHLAFGEIGSRQIWAAVASEGKASGLFPPSQGAGVFLTEIGWREFAYHLLFQFPQTPEHPMRKEFARFPWAADPGGRKLRAWQEGRTGYPIVDAGMRQLGRTGWMHNRVRMIVASFLVKHLRLPWQKGAAWFWEQLLDADLANNTLGWQWSAGCGADAAPYFRIFAPVLQGRKFDPAGEYVRRWVPELSGMSDTSVHAPWEAKPDELAKAGVRLGEDYPYPIVEHARARAEALAAFQELRNVSRA